MIGQKRLHLTPLPASSMHCCRGMQRISKWSGTSFSNAGSTEPRPFRAMQTGLGSWLHEHDAQRGLRCSPGSFQGLHQTCMIVSSTAGPQASMRHCNTVCTLKGCCACGKSLSNTACLTRADSIALNHMTAGGKTTPMHPLAPHRNHSPLPVTHPLQAPTLRATLGQIM